MGLFKFIKNIFGAKSDHQKDVDSIYGTYKKDNKSQPHIPIKKDAKKTKRKKHDLNIDETSPIFNQLGVNNEKLSKIVSNISRHYHVFHISKKRSGFRRISAPSDELLKIQRNIYHNILKKIPIHPAAKGFIEKTSVVDNAKVHLHNSHMLKIDIWGFFGSIKKDKIVKVFSDLGYNEDETEALSTLCTLGERLPQGAPTSPVLSNIVCLNMDIALAKLAGDFNLKYSRYADDMVFSGNLFNHLQLLESINKIMLNESFVLNREKTLYAKGNKRKIITGISISSGKLTIPRAKKRELRKIIHHICTKGLKEHMHSIKSSDPAYLKRIIGYLNFWLQVEPENEYVKNSKKALIEIKKSL